MTTDEAALLRAIAAHPGEVTARLAYADWLDEHGRGIEAAWVRDEGTAPWVTELGGGDGDGGCDADGTGTGDDHGSGNGDGDGDGYGDSNGDGYGDGTNCGDGAGRGDGRGYGAGGGGSEIHDYSIRGGNHGYGRGYGYCYGDSDGDGDGNGQGHGYNPIAAHNLQHLIPHQEVHMPESGAYVIVRSRDQGCVCGEYRGHHGREVVLGKARQIYSWEGGRLTLFDFAVVPGPCRLSREAPGEVVMLEACGIIPTTPEVEAFLRAHPGE